MSTTKHPFDTLAEAADALFLITLERAPDGTLTLEFFSRGDFTDDEMRQVSGEFWARTNPQVLDALQQAHSESQGDFNFPGYTSL